MRKTMAGRHATIENLESRLLASTTPQLENLALAFRGRGGEIEFTALLQYAQSLARAHDAAVHPITKPAVKPVAHPKPIAHAPAPKPVFHTHTTTTHLSPAPRVSTTPTITTGTLHNVPVNSTTLAVKALTGAVAAASGPATYSRDSFLQFIHPMQHSTAGRLPLFVWFDPTGWGGTLALERQSGVLRQWIDQMAVRGMVPLVNMDQPPEDAVALALTLQDAHQPIFLVFYQPDIIQSTTFKNVTIWSPGVDIDGTPKNWALPQQADGSLGAAWMRQQLLPLQQAGVHLSGAWFDDERSPYPWVPFWNAEKNDPRTAPYYPAGVLADLNKFRSYVLNLRSQLLSQVMADPIHQMFPGAIVGNFGTVPSGTTSYVDPNGLVFPQSGLGTLDVSMPVYYTYGLNPNVYLKKGQVLTQSMSDAIVFQQYVTSAGTSGANSVGKTNVSWVAGTTPTATFPLSRATYREMLRHIWLRGANSMFLFGFGWPSLTGDQTTALNSLEDARAVYDEMLAYRPFLDQGTPMNLSPADINSPTPTWSGLKLGNQALVRTFSVPGQATQVTIQAFAGQSVTLDAPQDGATYLITQSGPVTRVS